MEVQLQELINKIKDNGVKVANSEKNRIITDAEQKAKEIIQAAEQKAKELEKIAKEQIALSEERNRESLQLAARDLILNISKNTINIFNDLLRRETAQAMNQVTISTLIGKAIKHLGENGSYEISLSESDAKLFGEALKKEFTSILKNGITIKPTRNIDAGFRIMDIDGSLSYDFSDEMIAENLAAYVNPQLAEDIRKSVNLIR